MRKKSLTSCLSSIYISVCACLFIDAWFADALEPLVEVWRCAYIELLILMGLIEEMNTSDKKVNVLRDVFTTVSLNY